MAEGTYDHGPGTPALLLTVREAARMLAVGRTTVYVLISNGQLPTIHIGRSVRIRRSDVIALIADFEPTETTAASSQ